MAQILRILMTALLVLGLGATACALGPRQTEPAIRAVSSSTARPTFTATASPLPHPTDTPDATATQRSEDLLSMVDAYFRAGYISSDQGTIYHVSKYEKEWTDIRTFDRWPILTQSHPDFILRADIKIETSHLTRAMDSACGFMFRTRGQSEFYILTVALDGKIYLWGHTAGGYSTVGNVHYGPRDTTASVTLTLATNGRAFHVFLNDKLLTSFTGLKDQLTGGGLGYVLLSGTATDFGTRCQITNAALWAAEP